MSTIPSHTGLYSSFGFLQRNIATQTHTAGGKKMAKCDYNGLPCHLPLLVRIAFVIVIESA